MFHCKIGPDFGLPGGEEREKEEACKPSLVELKNWPPQMIQADLIAPVCRISQFFMSLTRKEKQEARKKKEKQKKREKEKREKVKVKKKVKRKKAGNAGHATVVLLVVYRPAARSSSWHCSS